MRSGSTTRIDVVKGTAQRYRSVIYRGDGVVVGLEGGSYNRIGGSIPRVPHDVAHHVVETAFGLDRGLWGVLAMGGLVQNAEVVGGRKPPHAVHRAMAITDAAGEQLRQAEVLVRAVADATRGGWELNAFRGAVGERWWSTSVNADALRLASAGLLEAAERWDTLPAEAAFQLTWTVSR